MTTLEIFELIGGLIIGYLIIAIPKSIYTPKTRWIQGVMLFGKMWTMIANVEDKVMYMGETIPGQIDKHDLIDSLLEKRSKIYSFLSNLYFFLWPLFRIHEYPLNLIKVVKANEVLPTDTRLREDKKSGDIWISRSTISNHLEFREDYPCVSAELSTHETANVILYTNNMIEIVNGKRALFGIKNWYIASMEIINGAQKGLVADRSIFELNQFSSEDFSEKMKELVNPALDKFGVKLYKCVFKDFEPADEKARQLMDSKANVILAEETGKARIVEAEKNAKVTTTNADAQAYAYTKVQNAITEWTKKNLIETGLARVKNGKIVELLPDANTKISAEAMKELSKLTGTLVMDSGSMNKFLNINSDKKKEDKE